MCHGRLVQSTGCPGVRHGIEGCDPNGAWQFAIAPKQGPTRAGIAIDLQFVGALLRTVALLSAGAGVVSRMPFCARLSPGCSEAVTRIGFLQLISGRAQSDRILFFSNLRCILCTTVAAAASH